MPTFAVFQLLSCEESNSGERSLTKQIKYMTMLRKACVVALCAMGWTLTADAQKTAVYRSSQTRLVEPRMGVYTKPLIADLEIVKDLGKIKDVWTFTPEEVNALGGDEVNVRTRALYLSVDSHKVDVIVAASFDMESTNAGTKVTVIGYPARFVNWRTATDADNEWIRNEVMKPEDNRKATQAISQ